MRGQVDAPGALFSYVSVEERVPADHPLRRVKARADAVLVVTFGLPNAEVVVLVYTERDDDMHVTSLRKAAPYEARYYFEAAEEYLRKGG